MRQPFSARYGQTATMNRKRPAVRALTVVTIALLPCGPPANGQCERAKLLNDTGQNLDRLGFAVAISRGTALVGAPWDDDRGDNYGMAFVFQRSGAEWLQVQGIPSVDSSILSGAGWALAVENDTALLGIHGAQTAHVFERIDGIWQEGSELLVAGHVWGDLFGDSVALCADVAVVSAPEDYEQGTDSGSVYVFRRAPEGTWSQEAKLLAGDGDGYDRFGHSVAICGDIIAVGAPDDEQLGNWSGSAYVFERDPNGVWQETAKLLPHDGSAFWSFGESIAVHGERVLVGAMTASAFAPSAGTAYIFERDPNEAWIEVKQLVSDDIVNSDAFGVSVALEGEIALIGAENSDDNAPDSGAAYVFVRQPDGTWPQVAKIGASDGGYDDHFGRRVGLSGNTAVIGAHYDDDNGDNAGAAYIFAVGPDEDGDGIMDVCLCPGDLDHDLDVDLSDLAQLLSNYGETTGMTYEDGDLDEDGDVDLTDLAALLAEYGTICP